MANETTTAPAQGGGKMMLILLVGCGVLALAAGGAVPYFFLHESAAKDATKDEGHHNSTPSKQAYVPFGDPVVVNLNEDRLTRYLKIKILLVVDARDEKMATELVQKKKPALRNWLIANLSDKSLPEVTGAAGLNKMRREIWHQFNSELYPDGSEKILDIFFEEFVVQ
jgi:flagellar basal body-associated protein FliL